MRLSAISLALGLLVSACGGGGGGGDTAAPTATATTTTTPTTTSTPLPATPPVTLDSSNYILAATEATSAALFLLDAPSVALGVESTDSNAIVKFGLNQAASLDSWFKDKPVATGVVQSQTENCSAGGTLTVTINDADNNNALSAGDTVVIKSSNCKPGDGTTINGEISFNILQLTGVFNSNNFKASIQLNYKNLSVVSASSSAVGNGDLTLSASASGINVGTESLSANNFTANATYGGISSSRTLTSFSGVSTKSPNLPSSAFKTVSTVKGFIASSALPNLSLNLETNLSFSRQSNDRYPSSGQVVITANGSSKTRVSAKVGGVVLIELDANGDGIYELSATRPWSSIL